MLQFKNALKHCEPDEEMVYVKFISMFFYALFLTEGNLILIYQIEALQYILIVGT